MVNRPKQIGTAAETAVVRAARTRGFPHADRLTLTGNKDRGDISLAPGVIVEIKGGEKARAASDLDIERWLGETLVERANANADVAFLVTQRRGVGYPNAHRWWAWFRLSWFDTLRGHDVNTEDPDSTLVVRMLLDDALTLIRNAGYGQPLTNAPEAEALGSGAVREGAAS